MTETVIKTTGCNLLSYDVSVNFANVHGIENARAYMLLGKGTKEWIHAAYGAQTIIRTSDKQSDFTNTPFINVNVMEGHRTHPCV
jgi:hypothetical protein